MSNQLPLKDLVQTLVQELGLDLRGYKRSTLERRFRKRISQLGIPDYGAYLEYLRQTPDEVPKLLNTVLINVTEFFRDPQAWEAVRKEALPRLFKHLKPGETFRAWVAGCASGEEVYSLAILIADYLGPSLPEFDIKLYATDVHDEALTIARRGEYASEALRRVRPEWRAKYFQGNGTPVVNRDIRRLVIFGRSNLLNDAPISHVNLILCRNVLIYFEPETQKKILERLHYALEENGILVLGKSESQARDTYDFKTLNSRWRILQRKAASATPAGLSGEEDAGIEQELIAKLRREAELLKLYNRSILQTLDPGMFVLDGRDIITGENEAALKIWDVAGSPLTGRHLGDTPLMLRCPQLPERLEESRAARKHQTVRFEHALTLRGERRVLAIAIKPVLMDSGERIGTLIYTHDAEDREKLQTTVEQLEATGEELQSANEELESTNEELQSTNEELETTNEELQSTNEELETTNEELQSLNEELESVNEELERRTDELDHVNARYAETLERMPWPVMLVDAKKRIQFWNSAAQKLFQVDGKTAAGLHLQQLPIEGALRNNLQAHHASVLKTQKPAVLRGRLSSDSAFEVHFKPLSQDSTRSVLIMFNPLPLAIGQATSASSASQISSSPAKMRRENAAAKTSTRNRSGKKPRK